MTKSDTIAALRRAMAEVPATSLYDAAKEETKTQVRRRALRLLDARDRSRHELRERLLTLDFPAAAVDEVISDLERVGLLNDERFASEWVRQRLARRGKSRRVLARELADKGVDPSVREAALGQVSRADEREVALQFARKKARTLAPPESYVDQQKALRKIVGVLARRGFEESMSISLARQALEERCEMVR